MALIPVLGGGANLTGAQIKMLYEAEADTNAFDDAAKAKLDGVDENAADDQTGAEIKAAYEAENNTNAFDDAAKSKLANIESGATADQTNTEILNAWQTATGRNAANDGGKLDGIEALADVTDATNVNAAGAVMEADTSTATFSFVIDEDDMNSNLNTKVPTQQSVKAFVDNAVIAAGAGDVVGPASAVDEQIAVFDGITGKLIKDGGVGVALISTASQPGDNISDFTNDSVFITAADVTFENLDTNSDVGTGAAQVAAGNHTHTGVYEPVDATIIREADVDDVAVNGVTTAPISSNWAYDHENNTANPHTVTAAQIGVESGATADQTGAEIDALLDTEIGHANWTLDWTAASANFATSGTAATGVLTVTGTIAATHTGGNDAYAVTLTSSTSSGEFLNCVGSTGNASVQIRQAGAGPGTIEVYAGDAGTAKHVLVGDTSDPYAVLGGYSSDRSGTATLTVVGDLAATGVIGGQIQSLANFAALASNTAQTGFAYIAEHTSGGYGGGFFIPTERTTPLTADGGNVSAHGSGGDFRWERLGPGGQIEADAGRADVLNFGAIPDGATDCNSAFAAAIAAADEILVPQGTFLTGTPINLTANKKLTGVGEQTKIIIEGDSVTGGVIQGNTGTGSSDAAGICVSNIMIQGSCDYGLYFPANTSCHLSKIRFAFTAGNLSTDCIFIAQCWGESTIKDVFAFVAEGGAQADDLDGSASQSVIHADGDCNGLNIDGVYTIAQTKYGIIVTDAVLTSGNPYGIIINNATLQRHQIGLAIHQARGITVSGLKTEIVQYPIVLGDRDNNRACRGGTFNSFSCFQMDASAQGWNDNDTAAVELSFAHGNVFNAPHFGNGRDDDGYNAFLLRDSLTNTMISATANLDAQSPFHAQRDWRGAIELHASSIDDAGIEVIGNGIYGREHIIPDDDHATSANLHQVFEITAGVPSYTEWTPDTIA